MKPRIYCPRWVRKLGPVPGVVYERRRFYVRARAQKLVNWVGWHTGWYHLKWWVRLATHRLLYKPSAFQERDQ